MDIVTLRNFILFYRWWGLRTWLQNKRQVKTKEVNLNNPNILHMRKNIHIVKNFSLQIHWLSAILILYTHTYSIYVRLYMCVCVCIRQPHFLEFKNSAQRYFMHNNPTIDPLAWLPFSDENLAIFSWNESSEVMCSLAYGVRGLSWGPLLHCPAFLLINASPICKLL